MWYCGDWWNERWSESDSSFKSNVVYFINNNNNHDNNNNNNGTLYSAFGISKRFTITLK